MKNLNLEHALEPVVGLLSALELFCCRDHRPTESELPTNGWCMLANKSALAEAVVTEFTYQRNQFLAIRVVERNSLLELIKLVLTDSQITGQLERAFGAPFSVDYVYDSEIFHVPQDLTEGFYAEHFHRDLSFTNNVVKLFLLQEATGSDQGPLRWYDRSISRKSIERGFSRNYKSKASIEMLREPPNEFTGERGDACMVLTRSCLHAAGVPAKGRSRRQLMLQLNPARQWSYHRDIYERQLAVEPNWPLLRSVGRRVPVLPA